MELKDAIKQRRSIREFKDVEVSDAMLQDIIELAKLAPSAGNLQSYNVIIFKDKFVNFIICANTEKSASRYGDRGRDLYAIQDATIFASYVQLIATDMGLSTCWVGAFNEKKIRKQFHLSESLKPIALIAIGYSNLKKGKRNRRSFEEIVI